MKLSTLAYIAGFVDGEGCIGIAKNGSISISIVNTARPVLDFIKNETGVGTVIDRKQRVNKRQFLYRVYGDACESLIEHLIPFLIDKRDQAELLLQYRRQCRPVRTKGVKGQFRNPEFHAFRERMAQLKRIESDAINPRQDCDTQDLLKAA